MTTGSIKEDLQLLCRRELLEKYPEMQAQATVNFVMSVAQAVVHLDRCLQYRREFGTRIPQLDDTIAYLTASINSRFQQCFGRDLFEQQESSP